MHRTGGWSPGLTGIRKCGAAGLVVLGAALLLMVGCSSDDPSLVGSGLVETHLDTQLDTLLATAVIQFQPVAVDDPDVPFDKQELLYMGSQGGTSSALLVNFDFSDVFTDSFPESAWTSDNIDWVKLQIIMPEFYSSLGGLEDTEETEKGLSKGYEVFMLDAPFDSTAFPGPLPAFDNTDLNINPEITEAGEVNIDISLPFFLAWVQNGGQQGLLIREAEGSDQGLVGFASRDNLHMNSQFGDLGENTTVGPALRVQFAAQDSIISLASAADISSFHQVADVPGDIADGFAVQGCLRNYPVLRFDVSSLPQNVAINRAVLHVTNDTTTSFGNLSSLVVSEFNLDYLPDPGDTLTLEDLDLATYTISGMTSLDPTYNDVMQFNVTQAIQRLVNSVYEGEKAFIMTLGEDAFPVYDLSTVDPDFYFNRFNFFGSAAADSLRPQLRITYSGVDELTEGGE